MTKIDIFSGFLGAGKTTLIKKLIGSAYKGQKIVLIENEFGEIGIDGGFLNDSGIEITEMNSGCICCSLVGDFGKALNEVLEKFSPDRIIIEPSGVGKLSDVVRAVSSVLGNEVVLNSTTTVVDATKCKVYMKNFGEFFNNQVESAGCVVLSRTDVADEKKVSEAIELIKSKNPNANIIATPLEQLDGADILKSMENRDSMASIIEELNKEEDVCPECGHHHHHHGECEHDHDHYEHDHHDHDHHDHDHEHHDHEHHDHDHHHHHADEVFTSWGLETAKSFEKEEIASALNAFENPAEYGTILRAKGYVKSENGWIYFDYVPGQVDLRDGSPAVIGRICVIGTGINEEKLEKLFKK